MKNIVTPFKISKAREAEARASVSESYWKMVEKRVNSKVHKKALMMFLKVLKKYKEVK